eukprot:364527-Chlamydomonas_euryale.AAC.3
MHALLARQASAPLHAAPPLRRRVGQRPPHGPRDSVPGQRRRLCWQLGTRPAGRTRHALLHEQAAQVCGGVGR